MKPTKSDKPLDAQQSPNTSDEVRSNLAAMAREERAFAERKESIRRAFYDKLTSDIKALALELTSAGFEMSAIGKTTGIWPARSTATAPANKPSGPTTHTGWFNLFRSRGIQTYLRTHPDLAARLKTESIKSTDYPNHIPPTDLESIDSEARTSAQQRCPSIPSAS